MMHPSPQIGVFFFFFFNHFLEAHPKLDAWLSASVCWIALATLPLCFLSASIIRDYQDNISSSHRDNQTFFSVYTAHTKKTLVCARAFVKERLVCDSAFPFLSCIMVHLPSLWELPVLSSPPFICLSHSASSFFSLSLSRSLWTQIQSVIWSPCNGRVIGTLPWLVGNLGELCTGAICNIFSKLNFFLFLSPSLFVSLRPLLPPSAALNSNRQFFLTLFQISVLTFLFFPPFYSMLSSPALFFSFSFPPLPP